MKIDSIAFGAKFLAPVNIKKIEKEACKDFGVSLVELSARNKNDVNTVMGLIEPWGGFNSYTFDIAKDMHDICTNYKPPIFLNNPRIFALTKQTDDYSNLKSKEVLGIAELTFPSQDKVKFNYIETAPDFQKNNPNRAFGNIGKTLVKALMNMFKGNDLFLYSEKQNKDFYKQFGFKETTSGHKTTLMYFQNKDI